MKILIVIDMQNDFVTGVLGTPEARAIIPNVKAKIEKYVKAGDKVIFTRDTHGDDYLETQEGKYLPIPHCIHKSDGWQILSELNIPKYWHLDKTDFGYLYWLLHDSIKDGDDIELIGVCTDICVVSNAIILKASYPKSKIVVDASCCAGATPERHQAALTTMKSCQIDIVGE